MNWRIIVTGAVLVAASRAQGQPMKLHIVAPPTTAVSLEEFDRAGFAAKIGRQLGPETVLFVNHTDRAIVAARIEWTTTTPTRTKPLRYILEMNSFLSVRTPTIMGGNSRTVIGEGTKFTEDGRGFSSPRTPETDAKYSTGDTTVTVDAVMFSDGEVVGPDTRDLVADLEARRAAYHTLLTAVRQRGGTRETLLGLQNSSGQFTPATAEGVRETNALRELISMGLALVPEPGHGPNLPPGKQLASVEQWLLALPQPPKPFRGSTR
jgi:hypothetical protein